MNKRKIVTRILMLLAVLALCAGQAAAATTWYVNATGVCAGAGTCFATIQLAVSASADGDTIVVEAGNYAAGANLNKSLTLLGAQAGVDARGGRPGAIESVITGGGLGVFSLNATDITIDGFKFTNLKGRTLDTYYNADNFTMRNCILEGSSIDPGYNTGAIQFGGGLNLHANGLLFEQNLVTADNGQLFYMGHAMDNGTIRNNYFHGDSVAFGPFGERTGWVIEGNEFNGDVPGHGPYWGFGFNANLGDVVIENNYVYKMLVGIGQISVVGGTIKGNTFDDNAWAAFQLWGGEYGSVVSANANIENNDFRYNGVACTGFADAAHAIRIRPDLIDAGSIHIRYNSFTDLGVGACGQAWAIRNNSTMTAADAEANWWGQATGPLPGQFADPSNLATPGHGEVDADPWIYAYEIDPDKVGALGFWPDPVTVRLSSDASYAKAAILDAVEDLRVLYDQKPDAKLLDVAIKHIEKSLEADLWIDSMHLDPQKGEKVFHEEKEAAKKLLDLMKSRKSDIPDATLLDLVVRLVDVDRLLAETAVAQATALAGDKKVDKELEKCAKALAKAEDRVAKGDYDNAIGHFGQAWKHAQHALKKAPCADPE